MAKPLFSTLTAILGTAISASVLLWLVLAYASPPDIFGRSLLILGILAASGGFIGCWSTIVGHLSRIRLWSAQWTFLAGAAPFYVIALCSLFFSTVAFESAGEARMVVMAGFGSVSGLWARKKVYPELGDDPPFTSSPPPTLFPK